MAKIVRTLLDTNVPTLNYVFRAFAIGFFPAMVIAIVLFISLSSVINFPQVSEQDEVVTYIYALFVAPWLETLMMWPILSLLRWINKNIFWVAIASAIIWGAIHAMGNIAQGLTVIWVFFVFSMSFLAWREKSLGRAILVTSLIHFCHNTVTMSLAALLGG